MFINKMKETISRIISANSRIFCALCMMILTALMLLSVCLSVNTVNISHSDGSITIKTLRTNHAAILDYASVDYREEDLVSSVNNGSKISLTVESAFPVNIIFGENSEEVYVTPGMTAAEAVALADITLDENDTLSVDANLVLDESVSEIKVNYVELVTETTIKRLFYKSTKVYDSKSTKTVTTTKGSEGKAEVVTVKRYENGVYVGNESVKETVIVEPVDEVITVGTKKVKKPAASVSASASANKNKGGVTSYDKSKVMSTLTPTIDIKLDKNGVPVNYKKHMTVQATAYSPLAGSHCATGVRVQVGYIAVNPKIIPYGTKMYIVSSDGKYVYGYAVAADTGGFIKKHPTNVDLFMSTEALCNRFGRRNVEIYILE